MEQHLRERLGEGTEGVLGGSISPLRPENQNKGKIPFRDRPVQDVQGKTEINT